MWHVKCSILPFVLSFWMIGQCFGAFSPVFGVIKTDSPLKTPSPTPPSGKIFFNIMGLFSYF